MTPDEALARGVETDPAADLPRLVYADWLDENGRPAHADFLRTELELAKLPPDSPAAPTLRERLWQAWAGVDAAWLHRFTQPQVLRANPTPFPAAWLGFGLGDLRPRQGTYGGYDYHALPPLPADEVFGGFDYLGTGLIERPGGAEYAHRYQGQLDQLRTEAFDTGLPLPVAFLNLMADYRRLDGQSSVTDCCFTLPNEEDPIRSAHSGEGMHVLFYADSQYCLLWDLFVHRNGAACVIARSPEHFNPEFPEARQRAWFVAPSFEAFVRRVWMENQAWHVLQRSPNPNIERLPVPTAVQAYIDHYRQAGGGR